MFRPFLIPFLALSGALASADSGLPTFALNPSDGKAYPVKIDYAVASDADAHNCELFVDSYAIGDFTHNGATTRWIDTEISVNEKDLAGAQAGKIRGVGAYMNTAPFERDIVDPVPSDATYFGSPIAGPAGRYRLKFAFDYNTVNPYQRYVTNIEALAFFVDVERRSGRIDRLWLRDGIRNFDPVRIESAPDGTRYRSTAKSLGEGTLRSLDDQSSSPIFNQKKACANRF